MTRLVSSIMIMLSYLYFIIFSWVKVQEQSQIFIFHILCTCESRYQLGDETKIYDIRFSNIFECLMPKKTYVEKESQKHQPSLQKTKLKSACGSVGKDFYHAHSREFESQLK